MQNGISPIMPPNDSEEDVELQELLEWEEAQHKASAVSAKDRLKQELRLAKKYTAELGPRGVAFEVVNTDVGVFVLRKPEFVVVKQWNATSPKTDEDVMKFVGPSIAEPAPEVWRGIFAAHSGIAHRCALALMAMNEAKAAERGKKY